MASNLISKYPVYSVQYYEYDRAVEYPLELGDQQALIDGFCAVPTSKRISLGYLLNFNRRAESFNCLKNIGRGLSFTVNNDLLYMSWLEESPVYVILKSSDNQIQFAQGETKYLYSIKDNNENKTSHPKKISKALDDLKIKISFGQPFQLNNNKELISPCWIEMNLNRFS